LGNATDFVIDDGVLFEKAYNAIMSCKTVRQLIVAIAFSNRVSRLMPYEKFVKMIFRSVIKHQARIIRKASHT
jgi:hypothetical protein